jgi:hypothetical protein
LTVTVLFLWGALSDGRTGLCFVYAAGPRQRSLPRVRVPWISRPYFTASVLRLPISSPPMTRRVTVEVFDFTSVALYNLRADCTEKPVVLFVSSDRTENFSRSSYCCVSANCRRDVFTSALRSNVHDADLIENILSVEICLRSRCLATVLANTPHCVAPTPSDMTQFLLCVNY